MRERTTMNRLILGLTCVLLSHAAAVALIADEKPLVVIPPDGLEYLPENTLGFPIVPKEGEGGVGKVETLKEEGGPCAEFRRFTISKLPPLRFKVQLQQGITGVITKGDTCLLVFYARAVGTDKAIGSANVMVRTPPNFITLAQQDFVVGKEWEAVVVPFFPLHDSPDGKAAVAIHLGGALQTIDIGGLRLLDYGPEYPVELLPKAGTRKAGDAVAKEKSTAPAEAR